MDKQLAQKIIEETFQNSFEKEKFVYFIKNLLNNIEILKEHPYSGPFIPDPYKPYVNTLYRVGKYVDNLDNEVDVLIVGLKKETSLERARTAQRNFIAWYLNGSRGGKMKDAALVAFVSPNPDDWRFSLVKMEYKLVETPAGKIKAEGEFTPARRWSFLVGKNENSHTAKKQLLPILQNIQKNPKLSDLENAFNIEIVTKEFFGKYKELFLKTTEELEKIIAKDSVVAADFKEKNVDSINFAKKLLGQIVFLYFLQKKGWLGVKQGGLWGAGPKNFLRKLFNKEIAAYKNFFNDIMEPLFYKALAVDNRGKESIYEPFNCRIPFLNGGLFDPINNYDWECTDIIFPDELFSNNEKTKEGDLGTGILDVFDRYNFTVKEDEPLEKEVAIDPEMLGKVFENLLEVKDRKSKGSYYTPREIVHYMCQESLINYLAAELSPESGNEAQNGSRPDVTSGRYILSKAKNSIPLKQEIETFIRHGELAIEHDKLAIAKKEENSEYNGKYKKIRMPESIKDNAKLIDEKLKNIRVCDPAVGSGAFLVGMINEIIRARNALTPYLSPSPLRGEGRGEGESRSPYHFKRQAIQNCLYGVDIDPGAVEIAKLRLWLSLVVDEEDVEEIKPLPNLDYKIMQGNSLLEEFEGIKLFDEDLLKSKLKVKFDDNKITELKKREEEIHKKILIFYAQNPSWQKDWNKKNKKERPLELLRLENELFNTKQYIKNEINKSITLDEKKYEMMKLEFDDTDTILQNIKDLHKEFFNTSDKQAKSAIKEKISRWEWTLIEATLREQNKKESLARLEEYKNANTKPFFLWKLHFSEVFQEKGGFDVVIANPPYVRADSPEIKEQRHAIKQSNNYQTLWEKWDLYVVFIERGYNLLRKNGVLEFIVPDAYMSSKYAIKSHKYFLENAMINRVDFLNEIKVFEAAVRNIIIEIKNDNNPKHIPRKIKHYPAFENFIILFSKPQKEVGEYVFKIETENKKIGNLTNIVDWGEICYVSYGLRPSSDERYWKGEFKKEDLISDVKDKIHPKAYIEGKWIGRYVIEQVKYLEWGTDRSPKKLVRPTFPELYLSKKIMMGGMTGAIFDDTNLFCNHSITVSVLWEDLNKVNNKSIYGSIKKDFAVNNVASFRKELEKKSSEFDLKYLLAILNSKFGSYCLNSVRRSQIGFYPDDLKKLPIKKMSTEEQKPFVTIVDKILAITKGEDYSQNPAKQAKVKAYERQIDEMVYKLYDLTTDEIAIVEGYGK